jgi:hypothetical protein
LLPRCAALCPFPQAERPESASLAGFPTRRRLPRRVATHMTAGSNCIRIWPNLIGETGDHVFIGLATARVTTGCLLKRRRTWKAVTGWLNIPIWPGSTTTHGDRRWERASGTHPRETLLFAERFRRGAGSRDNARAMAHGSWPLGLRIGGGGYCQIDPQEPPCRSGTFARKQVSFEFPTGRVRRVVLYADGVAKRPVRARNSAS